MTASYSVNWLGMASPSDNYSQATRINDNGQVIGTSIEMTSDGLPAYEKAFTWTSGGGMQTLGNLNGNASTAWGLNNSGKIVGWYHYPVSPPGTTAGGGYYEYAAVWNDGVGTTIPGTTGYMWSTAYGVNDNNVVVGVSDTPAGGRSEGFTYDGTTLKFLGTLGGQWSQAFSINNNNVVAGFADTGTRTPPPGATAVSMYHACIWSPSGVIKDLGTLGADSYAYEINDLGQVAGSSITVDADGNPQEYHPFLYDGGTMIDLVGLGGNGEAWAINNRGQVVGGSAGKAFLYENSTLIDLNTLFPAGTDALTQAMDINNLGQIVGVGIHNGRTEAFVLTPGETPVLPPTADAGGPYEIFDGDSLTLSAELSSSPGNSPLTYSWDVNGDGVYGDASGVSPTLTWRELQALGIEADSTYDVTVEVDDGNSSAVSPAATLTVNDRSLSTPPTASLAAGDSFKGVRGQNRSYTLRAADPSADDQAAGFTFVVNWGDGEVEDYVGPSGTVANHKYAVEGSYTITLTALDQHEVASTPVTATAGIQITEQQGTVRAISGTKAKDSFQFTSSSTKGSLNTPYGTFATAAIQIYGNGGGDVVAIQGTSGSDTLIVGSTSVTVNGLSIAGLDLDYWTVDGLAGDDIFTLSGSGLPVGLKGGDGNDRFNALDGGAVAGKIDGGAGTDIIDYSALRTAVTVNLQTQTASAANGFVAVEGFIGTPLNDTLVGTNAASTWTVGGTNAGTVNGLSFSSFENLTGGSGPDTFVLPNLRGVSGRIDGGAGVNVLDYSQYVNGVTVNLTTGAATNVLGGVINVANVYGGRGNDVLTGNAGDNLLLGNAGNDTLDGGAGGNDILVGGVGNDNLTGGPGRSLLFGGAGADVITGGADEDLVIGGTTNHDATVAALTAILAEWKRTDLTYRQRIDHLMQTTKGGLNGKTLLKTSTVKDDATADSLRGNTGLDWFWGNSSEVLDLLATERVSR